MLPSPARGRRAFAGRRGLQVRSTEQMGAEGQLHVIHSKHIFNFGIPDIEVVGDGKLPFCSADALIHLTPMPNINYGHHKSSVVDIADDSVGAHTITSQSSKLACERLSSASWIIQNCYIVHVVDDSCHSYLIPLGQLRKRCCSIV